MIIIELTLKIGTKGQRHKGTQQQPSSFRHKEIQIFKTIKPTN